MTATVERTLGDPDANVVYPITDATGADVNWATPSVIASKGGTTVTLTCAWLGSAAPTRQIKIPLATLPAGVHRLRLVVPGENDVPLGSVRLS